MIDDHTLSFFVTSIFIIIKVFCYIRFAFGLNSMDIHHTLACCGLIAVFRNVSRPKAGISNNVDSVVVKHVQRATFGEVSRPILTN